MFAPGNSLTSSANPFPFPLAHSEGMDLRCTLSPLASHIPPSAALFSLRPGPGRFPRPPRVPALCSATDHRGIPRLCQRHLMLN